MTRCKHIYKEITKWWQGEYMYAGRSQSDDKVNTCMQGDHGVMTRWIHVCREITEWWQGEYMYAGRSQSDDKVNTCMQGDHGVMTRWIHVCREITEWWQGEYMYAGRSQSDDKVNTCMQGDHGVMWLFQYLTKTVYHLWSFKIFTLLDRAVERICNRHQTGTTQTPSCFANATNYNKGFDSWALAMGCTAQTGKSATWEPWLQMCHLPDFSL